MLKRLFGRSSQPAKKAVSIIVVSGLPRSGTSMMMKMLEATGLEPVIDEIRIADDDNPKGYYEFERVKQLDKGDYGWLDEADGKVVKVISALLEHLPAEYENSEYSYKVLFMRREMSEILASQKKMLVNREEATDKVKDAELTALFEKHLSKVKGWLSAQPNVDVLYVDYNQLLSDPNAQIPTINRFLGGTLDQNEMAGVVDPSLYRNRT